MKRDSHAAFKRNIDEMKNRRRWKEIESLIYNRHVQSWGQGWDAACFEVQRGNKIMHGDRQGL